MREQTAQGSSGLWWQHPATAGVAPFPLPWKYSKGSTAEARPDLGEEVGKK